MTAKRTKQQVDMARLFRSVTTTLKENQQSLNAADEYNHNHGDNMVDNFQVITRAIQSTKGAAPSDQLAYASQALSQHSQSGSARLYSRGLAQAANRLEGKSAVTQEDAMVLVQSLLGGQPAAQQSQVSGMEFLGSLLGGQTTQQQDQSYTGDLLGGLLGGQSNQQPGQSSGGDLLGSLLGSLMGGGAPAGQPTQSNAGQAGGGIDLNTLMTAGMAFFQARQQGAAPVQALVQAVMAGSQMQASAHHSQSGQLVAATLINTLGTMLSGKKKS